MGRGKKNRRRPRGSPPVHQRNSKRIGREGCRGCGSSRQAACGTRGGCRAGQTGPTGRGIDPVFVKGRRIGFARAPPQTDAGRADGFQARDHARGDGQAPGGPWKPRRNHLDSLLNQRPWLLLKAQGDAPWAPMGPRQSNQCGRVSLSRGVLFRMPVPRKETGILRENTEPPPDFNANCARSSQKQGEAVLLDKEL